MSTTSVRPADQAGAPERTKATNVPPGASGSGFPAASVKSVEVPTLGRVQQVPAIRLPSPNSTTRPVPTVLVYIEPVPGSAERSSRHPFFDSPVLTSLACPLASGRLLALDQLPCHGPRSRAELLPNQPREPPHKLDRSDLVRSVHGLPVGNPFVPNTCTEWWVASGS